MVPARLTVVTLGARDLGVLRRFYAGLGWRIAVDLPEIVAFETQGAVLSLFGLEDLAGDARLGAAPPEDGVRSSLAVNVDRPEEVDEAVATVRAAGGRITKAPVETDFGGRSAYFADPEDNVWEIVWIPLDNAMQAVIARAGGFGPAG